MLEKKRDDINHFVEFYLSPRPDLKETQNPGEKPL